MRDDPRLIERLDTHTQVIHVAAAPGAEVSLPVSPTSVVRIEAFADGVLVGARQVTFES